VREGVLLEVPVRCLSQLVIEVAAQPALGADDDEDMAWTRRRLGLHGIVAVEVGGGRL
jgi:hypothetical protein